MSEKQNTLIVTKLTTKSMVGSTSRIRELATEEGTPLYRVLGIATGVKRGSKQMPDGSVNTFLGLTGEFIGSALGKQAQYSNVLYLPGAIPALVAERLDNGATRIELGVQVNVVLDENSIVGYRYECESLTEIQPSQELMQLTEGI